jgi:hypothetical protein
MPAFLLAARGLESLVSGIALVNCVYRFGWVGVVLLVAGCTKGDEIVHLHEKRLPAPDKPAVAPLVGEKQRLLAAMIPAGGDQTWFFRMSGPEAIVTDFKPQFDAIVQSLKFADPELPKWKLPDGWIEEAPKKQFIDKNLRPADDTKKIAVTVSHAGGGDMPNINRWRGQLGLPPAQKADLGEFSKEFEVDGRKGRIVDLVGVAAGGNPMGGPMMGGKTPPNHPDVPGMPEMAPGGGEDAKYVYKLPEGWTKGEPKKMTLERITATENGETAEVTISVLPLRGGDPVLNINRWRNQIQLPPITDKAEILSIVKELDTADRQGIFVDLANPKAPAPNRILAVMVPTRTAMWFIKIFGPDALVGRQKANFEAFTHSFKFEN